MSERAPRATEVDGVASDLLRIHAVISRALEVGAAEVTRAASEGRHLEPGLATYLDCLVTSLVSHHDAEEEVAFPLFRERLPDAPYERLHQDHLAMTSAIAAVKEAAASAGREGSTAGAEVEDLAGALEAVRTIWAPHIAEEERWFDADSVGTAFAAHEQQKLARLVARHARERARPSALLLPFTLYHLAPAERRFMEAGLPWFVRGVLIPVGWRRTWEPMRPYLPYPPA